MHLSDTNVYSLLHYYNSQKYYPFTGTATNSLNKSITMRELKSTEKYMGKSSNVPFIINCVTYELRGISNTEEKQSTYYQNFSAGLRCPICSTTLFTLLAFHQNFP